MTLIISCQNLSKSYGARPLFQSISFGISDGDRMGMIGPNGSGKSTLLKILAGLETTDQGEISINKNSRVCYLPQEDIFPDEQTVHQALYAALAKQKIEDYEKEIQVMMMANQIGFDDDQQKIKSLSGGWRKRLAIACQLIQNPDLLLLDEPTNHLDLEGILWLEQQLKSSSFAYLAISHDRYFLENISSRIMELNRRYPDGHFSSPGTYSDFLDQRETFFAGQLQHQESLENKVRREVEWLRRGPKARTTKSHSRIKEAHQLIDNLDEVKYRNSQNNQAGISFSTSDRNTKKLLHAENISKSLGGKLLFSDLNLKLSPGVKLGLLGLNGSGKTTLIKVLMGQIQSDSGVIEKAERLRISFFDQNRIQLNNNDTLKQALAPHGDQVIYRDRPIHVVTWARRFLFQTEQLSMPIRELSGGERARILIARIMQEPADLLILDEPTNDLDIPTLEILEESLSDFPGALVLVTHDRYMLDRISTQLLSLDGQGGAEFFSDYSQWEIAQNQPKKSKKTPAPAPTTTPNKTTKKLSYREQVEFDKMEGEIAQAEKNVATWQTKISTPEISSNANELNKACASLQDAQNKVEGLYKRWAELEQKIKCP